MICCVMMGGKHMLYFITKIRKSKTILNKNGFTLIELMITTAIIGILYAVALPAYDRYIVTAKIGEAMEFADSYKLNITEYYDTNGRLPSGNAEAGIERPYVNGKIVEYVSWHIHNINHIGNRGYIDVALNLSKLGHYSTAFYLLAEGGPDGVKWSCIHPSDIGHSGAGFVDKSYLPASCQ